MGFLSKGNSSADNPEDWAELGNCALTEEWDLLPVLFAFLLLSLDLDAGNLRVLVGEIVCNQDFSILEELKVGGDEFLWMLRLKGYDAFLWYCVWLHLEAWKLAYCPMTIQ